MCGSLSNGYWPIWEGNGETLIGTCHGVTGSFHLEAQLLLQGIISVSKNWLRFRNWAGDLNMFGEAMALHFLII